MTLYVTDDSPRELTDGAALLETLLVERFGRHGTWAGYQRGCRLDCCTSAARNYQKRRRYDAEHGRPRMVSSLGARRRIDALACLGWSRYDIARRLGRHREWLRQVYICEQIHRSTHERLAAVYAELCMAHPPAETTVQRGMIVRTKRRAERLGYLPPLAWDDIDDPSEQPSAMVCQPRRNYRAEELLSEWDHLRALGASMEIAAAQLGVTVGAIEKAESRTRKAAS